MNWRTSDFDGSNTEVGLGYSLPAWAYSEVPNPNASRIAQRTAYIVAYTNAKATIAQALSGVTIEDSDVLPLASNKLTPPRHQKQQAMNSLPSNHDKQPMLC